MILLSTLFGVGIGSLIIGIISIIISTEPQNFDGIGFIIVGALLIAISLPYFIFKFIKRKKFYDYLAAKNFNVSKRICNFLYDNNSKLWCVYLKQEIYEISDIVKTTILKNSSRVWEKGSKRTVYRKEHYYAVQIITSNIYNPSITIDCGGSYSDAQSICAIIKILKQEI